MDYKVILSPEAEKDLDSFIQYLLIVKKSPQAAKYLLDDFEETIKSLSHIAGSLNLCQNPKLKRRGYRKMLFHAHRYFMLYRIENDRAIVDHIFHELQDYENITRSKE